MKQNRFRSLYAWGTLLPVLIILGNSYGIWDFIKMDGDTFTKLFMSIGALLVAFGIFQNPSDKDNF